MATTQRDYYEILGLSRGASDEEIKRAFRRLAQQWHPDVNTSPEADVRFKELNEAYQVLSDPARRQAYDLFGRAGAGAGAEGFGTFGGGFQGFGDLFDAFFGAGQAGGSRRAGPPAGADLRYDLRLTFAETISGAEKTIEFKALSRCQACQGSGAAPGTQPVTCPRCGGAGEVQTVRSTMLGQVVSVSACPRCSGLGRIVEQPCPTCRGDGRVEAQRTLQVTVPPGIDEGHQIRVSGEGEAGPRGGPFGNLYVVAHVERHPALRREATELFYELPLTFTQAALGASVVVPTAEGEERIEVKPGTQPGARIRLRGRGVPQLHRPQQRGDLHVLVSVGVPTKLSRQQRELLVAYAEASGETPLHEAPGVIDKLKDALG
ncbi:MAG TPA: molecular chaperone DnaJ [Candidatus Limnocylindrales bacterium]|nr:molecular chaperone DnaJ [Candidatus Limnocylindrales bacterium]